ncbi:MAG: ABC transporter ATP-binding protein [Chloroflexi bacterium]|nr:ABC transporter ATP-binding protein [Chloroflexota bacterium]
MKLAPSSLRRSLRAVRDDESTDGGRAQAAGEEAPAVATELAGRRAGPNYVVEAYDLTKIYDNRYIALNALNLRVRKNSVYGLVGPNGAGKSTAFRLMLGLQRPTAGEIRVLGRPMGAESAELRRRIGFLPTAPAFPRHMTPISYLQFVSKIVGLPAERAKIRMTTLLQSVDLTDVASQRIEGFSTGMETRLGIAAALMNDPELLVLDEPTYGLDPPGRRQMIELIRELSGRDRTIIIATHILNDVERVCNDVGVIAQGRLIYDGAMA